MVDRLLAVCLFGILTCSLVAAEDDTPSPVMPKLEKVSYRIRICEGHGKLQLWFNDEAKEHWDSCKKPIPDVPVYMVADGGGRGEGATDKDGVVTLPAVELAKGEKYRLAMGCKTHKCFSLHGMFIGDVFTKPGETLLYSETAPRSEP